MGSCKKIHAKILIARHFMTTFLFKKLCLIATVSIINRIVLSDARLMKNIVEKLSCKWACITIFEQL